MGFTLRLILGSFLIFQVCGFPGDAYVRNIRETNINNTTDKQDVDVTEANILDQNFGKRVTSDVNNNIKPKTDVNLNNVNISDIHIERKLTLNDLETVPKNVTSVKLEKSESYRKSEPNFFDVTTTTGAKNVIKNNIVKSEEPTSKENKDNVIKAESSESKEVTREDNARSIDVDVDKFVSPEFHNINNVYTVPVSSDTEKYVDHEFDRKTETSVVKDHLKDTVFNIDLTTPKTEFFDNKYKEAVESVNQKLEHLDSPEYSDTKEEINIEKLIEKSNNNANSTLNYTKIKNIVNNNVGNKTRTHNDLSVEEGTNIYFESSFNKTDVIEEPNEKLNKIIHEPIKNVNESLSNTVVKDSSKEETIDVTTEKVVILTTRKPVTLTKPPTNRNISHILSNKIETDTVKKANLLPSTSSQEESDYEPPVTVAAINVTKRGSVKYIDSLTTTTPIPTTTKSQRQISRNKINDQSKFNKTIEQVAQENQVIPLHTSSEDQTVTESITTEVRVKPDDSPKTTSLNVILTTIKPPINTFKTLQTTQAVSSETTTIKNDDFLTTVTPKTIEAVSFINEATTYKTTDRNEVTTEIVSEITTEAYIKENVTTDLPSTESDSPIFTTNTSLRKEIESETDPSSAATTSEPVEISSRIRDTTNIPEDLTTSTLTVPTTESETEETTKPADVKRFTKENTDLFTTELPITEISTIPDTTSEPVITTTEKTTAEITTGISTEDITTDATTIASTNEGTEIIKNVSDNADLKLDTTTIHSTSTSTSTFSSVSEMTPTVASTSTTISTAATTSEHVASNEIHISTNHPEIPVTDHFSTTEIIYIHIENDTILRPETNDSGYNYPTPEIIKPDLRNLNNTTATTEENSTGVTEENNMGDPDDNKGTIAAIVISSVGGVCLIVLAGLLYIMRKRQKRFNYGQRCTPVSLDDYSMDNVSAYNSVRRKGGARASKRSYGNPAFDDPVAVTHPLNFPALAKFASNLEDIKAEYEEIPQITARTSELPEGCETKNRYANVIPLPETRVFLNVIEGYPNSDYINANYVTGPKNTKGYYIACQGPMQNTIDDFWRMVWEQQSKVILMITQLFENGIEKCVDYLPPSEVLDCHRLFGDFQVTLKKREVKDKYIISSLQLKNMVSNSWREVTHFWYLGWPEKGIPSEANSIIAFLIEARSYMKSSTIDKKNGVNGITNGSAGIDVNPVVVHCSPGTGRTGVVIACDIAIREFEKTRLVDIPRIVYRIRRDRASSVQSREQYQFIYKVVSLYAAKLTGGALEEI